MPDRSCRRHDLAGAVAILWLVALLTGWLMHPSISVGAAAAASDTSAAQPSFAHYSGTVAPGETIAPAYQLRGSQNRQVNLKMIVAAPTADAILDFSITDATAHQVFAQSAGSGQTLWTTATLLPGINSFTISNPSAGGATLTYDLWLYDVGQAPAAFDGTARGISSTWPSQVSLKFPADGLYTFVCNKTAGRYQLLLDQDYIQKTIETNGSVVYFVAAGTHTLTVKPDGKQPATAWSVSVAGPGATTDTLPFARSGGRLGGQGNEFTGEWMPIRLARGAAVNLALALTGDSNDVVQAYLYTPDSTTPFTHTQVFGGETVWWTVDLPAGISRLQLAAGPANVTPLDYALRILEVSADITDVSGVARGAGGAHSNLRFETLAAGLYNFKYGLGAGRYQFLVDRNPAASIVKTVESSGEVQYFLAAGVHDLTIIQDSHPAGTAWSFQVKGTGKATDILPYDKSGGRLGGPGNDFYTERLPLFVSTPGSANFRLKAIGDRDDLLRASLYRPPAAAPVAQSGARGGETVWWTAELAQGLNWIDLVAEGTNDGPLSYQLTVSPVPSIRHAAPFSWSGVSVKEGVNSQIQIQTLVSGTYHILAVVPTGFANVFIDSVAPAKPLNTQSAVLEFDVPLDAGVQQFRVQQSTQLITTTWTVTVALQDALAPKITSRIPITAVNDVASTITIEGENFQPEATVQAGNLVLGPVTWLDARHLTVQIPARQPAGRFDLTVTNPDGKAVTVRGGLQILQGKPSNFYFPMVAWQGRK